MKKDKKLYEALSKEYYQTVEEKHLSKKLCDYFWQILVAYQRGYSFNLSHTASYSLIAMQNMQLASKYPVIFWNTANLIVDSSGIEDDTTSMDMDEAKEPDDKETDNNETIIEDLLNGTGDIEEEVSIFEQEDFDEYDYEDNPDRKTKKKKSKPMKYGKISSAIGKFQSRGISVLPPDINASSFTFTPDVEKNSINCGLRGITRISTDLVKEIIANRPYESAQNFMEKVKVNKTQMLNLIKCGAFDNLEGDREEFLRLYIETISDTKKRLTLQNMASLIKYNVLPESMSHEVELYEFNKFLKSKNYVLGKNSLDFFCSHYDINLLIDERTVGEISWKKYYDKKMDVLRNYIKQNTGELLTKLNNAIIQENWDKYAQGGISKWEMESMSFYYHDHELKDIREFDYDIVNFFELNEEPAIDRKFETKDGREILTYRLHSIAGAVLDSNKMKHTVTLLTKYGVVNVKVYNAQFVKYNKQLSVKGPDGKKKVLEKSWFSRGTLLLIQGIRRGNDWVPKYYKNSLIKYPIRKIEIDKHGNYNIVNDRMSIDGEDE